MPTIKSALTLLIAIGLPAGAQTLIGSPTEKCFATSTAIYRLGSTSDRLGTAVRVASDAAQPDLTMRITDSPETADFILVDDQADGGREPCGRSSLPTWTIRLNDDRLQPDVTVALAPLQAQRTSVDRPENALRFRARARSDANPATTFAERAVAPASSGSTADFKIADFKIYIRSTAFTVEEAAALFAVMVRASGSHAVAAR